MILNNDSGVVTLPGRHSMEQTVFNIEERLQATGVKLFAVVDHGGEAQQVGLHLRPTKLLIFGNPQAGTPLMVVSPTSAIDLPLKILVWQDDDGKVQISYNSASYLQARHAFPPELAENIALAGLLAAAVAD